jgi:hypothetical protein
MANDKNDSGSMKCAALFVVAFLVASPGFAGPPLETETARLPPQGELTLENVVEVQTAPDGKEFAVPLAITYGVTDRMEVLIEPVPYTSIRPKSRAHATGIGDLEITGTYLLNHEHRMPAFAVAGEVKIPTARDVLIGTRRPDYTGYLIMSKRLRAADVHGNLGYTLVGKPQGVHTTNMLQYAAAIEYHATQKFDVVSEVLGNSAGSAVAETTTATISNPVAAEVSGAELVGLVGFRYHASRNVTYSFGVTYDNNRAVLFRPGVTIQFR